MGETRVRVRIKYDKGSQTLNNVKPTAEDASLVEVASQISDLRDFESREFSKIVESDLLG